MREEVYIMTKKELARTEVLTKVSHKRLKQKQAAEEMGVSLRHFQRVYKLFREQGVIALISKKRGRASNNKLNRILVVRIGEIVTSDLYRDFGPTLMSEKLKQLHGISVSRETVRKLMIQNGVWSDKKEKRPVIHQLRPRRARCGELLQIDGSPHAWFEDRGEPCTLIVFVDDATGRTYGKFFESETTLAYMTVTEEYIKKYGIPLVLYSDKHSIFKINYGDDTKRELFTQFGRALHELNIRLIFANSPQAKGRVECRNKTLQDRLIKEMRLSGISSIEEANKFLDVFWEDFNKKFAVPSRDEEDAHRKVNEINLERILCEKIERVISKNLEFQFENIIYQVKVDKPCKSLIGSIVTVLRKPNGTLSFEHQGKPLRVQKFAEQEASGPELSEKEIAQYDKPKKKHVISKYHPWLQEGRTEARIRKYQTL